MCKFADNISPGHEECGVLKRCLSHKTFVGLIFSNHYTMELGLPSTLEFPAHMSLIAQYYQCGLFLRLPSQQSSLGTDYSFTSLCKLTETISLSFEICVLLNSAFYTKRSLFFLSPTMELRLPSTLVFPAHMRLSTHFYRLCLFLGLPSWRPSLGAGFFSSLSPLWDL